MTRVLVFDSGVGGLSVADAIAAAGLDLQLDYVADNAWLPYGEKPAAALRARIPALLAAARAELEPDLIVLACNTASTIALDAVRAAIDLPIVGVVPPIKPAAAITKTGVIGLLATPVTVQTPYVDDLIAQFAAHVRVVRCGASALVAAAEAKLAGEPVAPAAIAAAIAPLFAGPDGEKIDVAALACTHFPLLRDELAAAAPHAVAWLDSGEAIARRVASLLSAGLGAVRPRRAAFTAPEGARRLHDAFALRGFTSFARIGPAPGFTLAPLAVSGAG